MKGRMLMRRSLVAIYAAVVLSGFAMGTATLAEQPLRSPWDGKPVSMTSAPYSCPAVAAIPPDLITDGFYRLDDPTHSIVDPIGQGGCQKTRGSGRGGGAE